MKIRKRSWRDDSGSVREAWQVDLIDQFGNRIRRQRSTRKAAEELGRSLEKSIALGSYNRASETRLLRDKAFEYEQHLEARHAAGIRMTTKSLFGMRGHLHNYILANPKTKRNVRCKADFKEGIGGLKLSAITPGVVTQFRDNMIATGLSPKTTRMIIATLHHLFEWARVKDLVSYNPASKIRVYAPRNYGSGKVLIPKKEDVYKIINNAEGALRLRIIIAATVGVRAGELHALRWRHLVTDGTEVGIRVEIRVDAWGEEDGQGAKTRAGNRTIPISQSLYQELTRWRARTRYAADSDLLLPNSRGRYHNHDQLRKREFYPLLDRLRIARFRWHAFRHFAISTWIEEGLPPKVIQTFAGHSSLDITMNRYGHMFPSASHGEAMDRIGSVVIGTRHKSGT